MGEEVSAEVRNVPLASACGYESYWDSGACKLQGFPPRRAHPQALQRLRNGVRRRRLGQSVSLKSGQDTTSASHDSRLGESEPLFECWTNAPHACRADPL
jgi:hypothetical protein